MDASLDCGIKASSPMCQKIHPYLKKIERFKRLSVLEAASGRKISKCSI